MGKMAPSCARRISVRGVVRRLSEMVEHRRHLQQAGLGDAETNRDFLFAHLPDSILAAGLNHPKQRR